MSNYEFNALPFISYASFMHLESKVFTKDIQCSFDFCVYVSNWELTMFIFLIQSIPNFYLINQWNDIYMNLKMCKLISSLTSLLCHFSLSTMTFKPKKAKEKTTVFWALRSRLCINFPLFVCIIFKIFHILKYFSFLHYYHSIFFRK